MKTDLRLSSHATQQAALEAVLVYKKSKGSTASMACVEAAFDRLVEESTPLSKSEMEARLVALVPKVTGIGYKDDTVTLTFSGMSQANEFNRLMGLRHAFPPERWVVMFGAENGFQGYRSGDVPGVFTSEGEALIAIANNAHAKGYDPNKWKAVREDAL